MVAAGLLGGLSLVFMQLIKNMNQSQSAVQSRADEIELRASIRLILNDTKHCTMSLIGGSTPPIFEKENIDDEETEGLPVALYLSNHAGDARTLKKFNGRDDNPGGPDKSKFGKITIKTMKLIMNNPTGAGLNYPNSESHNDIGILRVVGEKKISASATRSFRLDFDLNVGMRTGQSPESSGETRILSCSPVLSSLPQITLLTMHSQTSTVPTCPSGWTRLWKGYSFLIAGLGSNYQGSSDLSSPGSCLKRFRPNPLVECQNTTTCDYHTSGDASAWLSIETIDLPLTTGSNYLLSRRISRCAVCEGVGMGPVIAVHSQTRTIPDCPNSNWTSLWYGYSFFIAGLGEGYKNKGIDLGKPGSCLRHFRPIPHTECRNPNQCDFYTSGDATGWLSTEILDSTPETSPLLGILALKAGRCRVCYRKP